MASVGGIWSLSSAARGGGLGDWRGRCRAKDCWHPGIVSMRDIHEGAETGIFRGSWPRSVAPARVMDQSEIRESHRLNVASTGGRTVLRCLPQGAWRGARCARHSDVSDATETGSATDNP